MGLNPVSISYWLCDIVQVTEALCTLHPDLENKSNNGAFLIELLEGLNELIFINCLGQWLAVC